MALPVLTLHLARTKLGAYCEQRIPAQVRDQVRLELEFADNHVTLIETRPHFRDPSQWTRLPVARFRFNAGSGTWALLSPGFGNKEAWGALRNGAPFADMAPATSSGCGSRPQRGPSSG